MIMYIGLKKNDPFDIFIRSLIILLYFNNNNLSRTSSEPSSHINMRSANDLVIVVWFVLVLVMFFNLITMYAMNDTKNVFVI